MEKIKNILITGYMGSGKSTLSKKLAKKLGWHCFDLDDELVKLFGMSVAAYFEQEGEASFRMEEWKLLEQLIANKEPKVLALGGGAYCQQSNIDHIKNHKDTITIYLKYTPEVLERRLEPNKESRPLIKDEANLLAFIRSHLAEREGYYQQANFTIENEQYQLKIIQQIESYLAYYNSSTI